MREQNLDGNGNIKVHEQGTASVSVSNASLPTEPAVATAGGSGGLVASPDDVDGLSVSGLRASLIMITRMVGQGTLVVSFAAGHILQFNLEPGNDYILPLTQPVDLNTLFTPVCSVVSDELQSVVQPHRDANAVEKAAAGFTARRLRTL